MNEHKGSCHCNTIQLILRDSPLEVSECNCSICRRKAGLWHYCSPAALVVRGAAVSYRQGDCALDLWHCAKCACMTHWTPTDPSYPRVWVNLRMFDPSLWFNLPGKIVDGASYRSAPVTSENHPLADMGRPAAADLKPTCGFSPLVARTCHSTTSPIAFVVEPIFADQE